MAGFFGLFDYTKEGPGVEKQERKKKGFFAFFEIYFRNFWGLVKMGAAYSLTSVLLVTNGFAKAGMTHVARSITREKHSFLFSDYMDTVKKNWKQSLAVGVLNTVLTGLLALDVWYFWMSISAEFSAFSVIGLAFAFFLMVCITFMKYYIWLLVITFELPLKKILKNSFHFVFLNLWRNILISVVLGVLYAVLALLYMLNGLGAVVTILFVALVLPGFKTSLVVTNAFPAVKKYMIDPYYAEHKGADIEKRLALGLDVDEDELPPELRHDRNDDTVFSDKKTK